tara:strand:- start:12593 stop:13543 length:951 start_codon:yes stop_codon:yes gene_type:complete
MWFGYLVWIAFTYFCIGLQVLFGPIHNVFTVVLGVAILWYIAKYEIARGYGMFGSGKGKFFGVLDFAATSLLMAMVMFWIMPITVTMEEVSKEVHVLLENDTWEFERFELMFMHPSTYPVAGIKNNFPIKSYKEYKEHGTGLWIMYSDYYHLDTETDEIRAMTLKDGELILVKVKNIPGINDAKLIYEVSEFSSPHSSITKLFLHVWKDASVDIPRENIGKIIESHVLHWMAAETMNPNICSSYFYQRLLKTGKKNEAFKPGDWWLDRNDVSTEHAKIVDINRGYVELLMAWPPKWKKYWDDKIDKRLKKEYNITD